jgi:hypothetical protein
MTATQPNNSGCGYFGYTHTNNTRLDRKMFFAGSPFFRVKEIEVFEINSAPPSAPSEKSTPSSTPSS